MAIKPIILEPNAGKLSHGPGGDRYVTKLSGEQTAGAFAMVEIAVAPGAGPPLHRHTREDEVFLVLEGTMSFWLDGRTVEAPVGTIVYAVRNVPHTFRNRGSVAARMMAWITPPAAEAFFRRFGEPQPGCGPPRDEVMIERIMKLAPEYGIEILGPSPL